MYDKTLHCYDYFSFDDKMSLRMVLSSDDGKMFYPDNRPSDFRVKLNRSIQLDGIWVIALSEFSTTERGNSEELYVYSDICQDSF